jgi:hypothetical protein
MKRGENYLVGVYGSVRTYRHLSWQALGTKYRISEMLSGSVAQKRVVGSANSEQFSLPVSNVDGDVPPGIPQEKGKLVVFKGGLVGTAGLNLHLANAIFQKWSLGDKLTSGNVGLLVHYLALPMHDQRLSIHDAELAFVNPELAARKLRKDEGGTRSHDGRRSLNDDPPDIRHGLFVLSLSGSVTALAGVFWLMPLGSYRSRFVGRGGLGRLMFIGGLTIMILSGFLLGLWE